MMQITDENRQMIMSTLRDPGMTVASNGNSNVTTEATVNFLDAQGKILMSAREGAYVRK